MTPFPACALELFRDEGRTHPPNITPNSPHKTSDYKTYTHRPEIINTGPMYVGTQIGAMYSTLPPNQTEHADLILKSNKWRRMHLSGL